jgi:hypothetical protein
MDTLRSVEPLPDQRVQTEQLADVVRTAVAPLKLVETAKLRSSWMIHNQLGFG